VNRQRFGKRWHRRERLERMLDSLDRRIERQAMRNGADALDCVRLVDLYHATAGWAERRILPFTDELDAPRLARAIRDLRAILGAHLEAIDKGVRMS